jgi:hypothetical protein
MSSSHRMDGECEAWNAHVGLDQAFSTSALLAF